MGHLKALASKAITSSIDHLSPSELVEEVCSAPCSVFTSRYPEWHYIYVERLASALTRNSKAKLTFQRKLSAYFSGELPRCKEIITSTLLWLLDKSTVRNTFDKPVDDCSTILRVSAPWPDRTKEALRISLDIGTFDKFKFVIARGPAATLRLIYLVPAVMRDWLCLPLLLSSLFSKADCDCDASPLTWQALAYYAYTGCVAFKPLGSENIEPPAGQSPSDPQFRGYPCSMKEISRLAHELRYHELKDLVTAEMLLSLTPENVVEATLYGLPPPPKVIDRGVKIICSLGNRNNRRIHSQLREVLEEAATGSRSSNLDMFSAFFDKLLGPSHL
ncbi:hypothetical protein BDM02DRAFT_3116340 [Thelephora ganbajun]|uniref:Uncharacterized protein n=1 Tax=Thelephora ganbajun TaxID=370292 RepID=A0ACB6ZE57_THEGA|nr:hypothetical protein BDM02DRAFT_3116340 [Thelephora ganbajun]